MYQELNDIFRTVLTGILCQTNKKKRKLFE